MWGNKIHMLKDLEGPWTLDFYGWERFFFELRGLQMLLLAHKVAFCT